MWVEPTAVEQATSEPVARHKATSICLSAGRRSLRRHRRRRAGTGRSLATSWPSISIRACAVDSVIMPSVYNVADRILAGPGTSRDVRDSRRRLAASRPGPPGDRSKTALDRSRITLPGPDFWKSAAGRSRRRGHQARPGQRFRRAFPRPRIRDRADQSPRRVQGSDGLVRRARLVPPPGDPAPRKRHLDRPRRADIGQWAPVAPLGTLDL